MLFCLSAAAQHRNGNGAGGPIPAGTQVQVRFIDNLDSQTAKDGDTFRATLEQAIVAGDRILYPKGVDVNGRVVFAHASGKLSDPGELELVLTEIVMGGRSYPVTTDPFRVKGESHTKSNTTKIGGGAALGAVIGAIAGGGKGAAIGAGVGAGAGTATAAATGKKEAKIESEAVLTFVASAAATATTSSPSLAPPTNAAQREDERGNRDDDRYRSSDDPYRSRDDAQGRKFAPEFSPYDRREIRGCLTYSPNLPPGLAKRDRLPPGQERQLERNGTLPPGLQKRAQTLPEVCIGGQGGFWAAAGLGRTSVEAYSRRSRVAAGWQLA
jgi:hypothetical protein